MKIKRFEDTFAEQTPEVQAKANALTEQILAELALGELRAARQLSQEAIAKVLGVKQPAIAKIEKRTDMYLSTLRNMIMAMGGTLDLVARFPEGSVKIKQFADLDGVVIEAEKLMEAGTSGEAVSLIGNPGTAPGADRGAPPGRRESA